MTINQPITYLVDNTLQDSLMRDLTRLVVGKVEECQRRTIWILNITYFIFEVPVLQKKTSDVGGSFAEASAPPLSLILAPAPAYIGTGTFLI